jgi:hypothetical protein
MNLSTIEMPFINLSYSPQQLESPAFLGIVTTNICDEHIHKRVTFQK